MPLTRARHYQWYATPNICVGAYADFDVLAGTCGLQVTDSFSLQAALAGQVLLPWSNLRARVAVFKLEEEV